MFEKKVDNFVSLTINWEKSSGRDFIWRHERTPYSVFIPEILLKRTTSTAAQRIYSEFLKEYPSISQVVTADLKEIEDKFKPIGLYRQRSSGLLKAAEYIVAMFDGQLPDNWNDLLKIPHIGPYSAGCILSFGYGIPAPAVDSNVERVFNRFFSEEFGKKTSYKEILNLSWDILPENDHFLYNYGLIDLGSVICSYKGCNHNNCPLASSCSYLKSSGIPIT